MWVFFVAEAIPSGKNVESDYADMEGEKRYQ